jgi:hypothetical protein
MSEPPARPPSMVLTDKNIPKIPIAGKAQDAKLSVETDDHKVKNQEVYRSGEYILLAL